VKIFRQKTKPTKNNDTRLMPSHTLPFVSILLCTYNGEQFLQTLLDSLLTQSSVTVEILIFDDASDDTTTQIIETYGTLHANISLHINPQRLGFIANFEQAITYCLEHNPLSYIALCDQDDVWHSNKLITSCQALKELETHHPNLPALVHCDLRLINADNQQIHPSFFTSKILSFPDKKAVNKLLGYNGVMGNTLLINHRLARMCLPFPSQLKYHDYWISLVNELFGKRKTIQQPLIDYRIHTTNTSNNRLLAKQGRKKLAIPFFCDQREPIIHHLLQKFPNLSDNDRILLLQFRRYLSADMNRIEAILFLFRNKFLKKNWAHKISVFCRLLITRKQSH
jgi:glycosyltransferase involved in cell wall biosynthesis